VSSTITNDLTKVDVRENNKMDAGEAVAETKDLSVALFCLSETLSAGSVIVELPSEFRSRVEAIGRDDDGAFLRIDDGTVFRIPNVCETDLDDLFSKDHIVIQEMDEHQSLLGEYPVTVIPYERRFAL